MMDVVVFVAVVEDELEIVLFEEDSSFVENRGFSLLAEFGDGFDCTANATGFFCRFRGIAWPSFFA